MPAKARKAEHAVRARISGRLPDDFREAAVARSRELGVMGWVRRDDEDEALVHAEGDRGAISELVRFLDERGGPVAVEEVKAEGHEQFAVRGVSAGGFVVEEQRARGRGFELRLEVDGVMRSWALPKGPSMDPAVKRMAIQAPDRPIAGGDVRIWDSGAYEQGGRVPWPEAIERGHAVFVLHGRLLQGGFALQRTRGGAKPQWLLIKRRDEAARPGSDVVAEAD